MQKMIQTNNAIEVHRNWLKKPFNVLTPFFLQKVFAQSSFKLGSICNVFEPVHNMKYIDQKPSTKFSSNLVAVNQHFITGIVCRRCLIYHQAHTFALNLIKGAHILKAGFNGSQKPQIVLNFPQKDCLRTRKTVNSSMCVRNKTKIITKHYQLLPIITNCYQLLPKLLIYALLSRNFIVAFYAHFPQIF